MGDRSGWHLGEYKHAWGLLGQMWTTKPGYIENDDGLLGPPGSAWVPTPWLRKLSISASCSSCALLRLGDTWVDSVRVLSLYQHLFCSSSAPRA